jgi:hypothetical protein
MPIIKIADVPKRNKLSSIPIDKLVKIKYKQDWFKPNGFWYAIDHWWLDFYTNDYEIKGGKQFKYSGYFYKIKIHTELYGKISNPDPNKILLIKTTKELKLLESIYAITNNGTKKLNKFAGKDYNYVNWVQVAKDFAGIEIQLNPWQTGQNTVNLNYKNYLPFWFSAWDVPSGCIWSWSVLSQIVIKAYLPK